METVPNRITGTEMEWSVATPSGDGARYRSLTGNELGERVRAYLNTVPHLGSAAGCFLTNGSRFYADLDSRREYATGEDDSFIGTTANEIASERIMRTAIAFPLQDKHGRITEELPNLAINRRVVDSNGTTWGYHENYNADAKRIGVKRTENGSSSLDPESLGLLGVHLATRGIFAGAGAVDGNGTFWINQKASRLYLGMENATTGNRKPVVNTRNESHADDMFRRVHVTSGDANMSPWATRMKLGTTSLVLRLIESGAEVDSIEFKHQLHEVSKLFSAADVFDRTVRVKNMGPVGALKLQGMLMDASKLLAKEVTLPEEEQWTLQEWEKVLADLGQNPLLARDRVEWILKKQNLERHHDRNGVAWDSELMRSYDRRWDNILDGVGLKLRESRWSQWMPDESLIADRVANPSQTTRAKIRGNFVRAFAGSGATADWRYQQITPDEIIDLSNPAMTTSTDFDRRIAELGLQDSIAA